MILISSNIALNMLLITNINMEKHKCQEDSGELDAQMTHKSAINRSAFQSMSSLNIIIYIYLGKLRIYIKEEK